MPVIQNFFIAPGIRLEWAPSRIYGILKQGQTTTVIAYGDLNTRVELYFNTDSAIKIIKGNLNFKSDGKKVQLLANVKPALAEYLFESGVQQVRLLVMQASMVKRTWIVESQEKPYLVTGPSYVADIRVSSDKIEVITEKPWTEKNNVPAIIYSATSSVSLEAPALKINSSNMNLALAPWQMKLATEVAAPDFNDTNWMTSQQPLQMGADGDISANAWYRTKVRVDTTGTYILRFKNLRERAALFLNGLLQDSELSEKSFTFRLEAGKTNTLSIFTAHNGRNKQLFYLGGLDTIDVKGITGPVTLELDGNNSGK